MGRKLFIYAQSGPGVGYGHLSRCLRLARVFTEFTISFYSNDARAKEYLERNGFSSFFLLKSVTEVPGGCDLFIYDTYEVDETGHLVLAEIFTSIVRFDDSRSPRVYGNELVISSLCQNFENDHILAGRDYFLMDERKPGVHFREGIEKIVLTIGASDKAGNMLRLLKNLPFPITPVIGPYFNDSDKERIRKLCPEVIEDSTDLLPFFSQADVVITAAGQTLHESIALGVPVVAITLAENQRNAIDCYRGSNLLYAGDISDEAVYRNIAAYIRLLGPKEERQLRAAMLRPKDPTSGARRIKRAVEHFVFGQKDHGDV